MVDRYLSISHPMRRYELMAQIRWQNSQLHDDLICSEVIVQRGGSSVEGDTWLDPEATWRRELGKDHQVGADVLPVWFFWDSVSERRRWWEDRVGASSKVGA